MNKEKEFTIGEKVRIMRSGELEEGWKVFTINTEKQEVTLVKEVEEGSEILNETVSLTDLREYNR